MRRATLVLLAIGLALPVANRPVRAEPAFTPSDNVSAVGRRMPPPAGRPPGTEPGAPGAAGPARARPGEAANAGEPAGDRLRDERTGDAKAREAKAAEAKKRAAVEAEMIKAQAAAEARNKAWDSRMRKTMGSICQGC